MQAVQEPERNYKPKGKTRDRQQAVAIQRILERTILDPATPPQSRASCAVAWSRIQDAKRVIDGKPLPGNLRPELEHKARKPKTRLVALPSDAIPLDQCPQDPPVSAGPVVSGDSAAQQA